MWIVVDKSLRRTARRDGLSYVSLKKVIRHTRANPYT